MSNTTHTPVTPEYLDELEALHKAATPGEWYLDYDYSPFGDGLRIGVKGESTLPRVMDDGSAGGEYGATTTLENMKFIVASHDALPALIAEVRRLNAALSEQTARAEKAEAERDELEEWGCKLVYEITDGRLSKCYDVDVVEDEVSFQWQKYVDSKVAETQAESAKWERIARWLAGQLQDLNTGATANDLIHHAQSEIEKERGE